MAEAQGGFDGEGKPVENFGAAIGRCFVTETFFRA